MSRLNDLIRQVGLKDESLATELRREFSALADRRAFGLNFERHVPEAVELPGRPVRKGDKVRVLRPRGTMPKKENDKLWRVTSIVKDRQSRTATLEALSDSTDIAEAAVEDLVVVAEFRDPIYPGLVSTGTVERGGDKPFRPPVSAPQRHVKADEPRITMSSAEWQAHVRAWMAAGAVEQELWRRLSNAHVRDADPLTLEAQRQMEQLTAEQGRQRIRLMLEASPGVKDEAGLKDLLSYFVASLRSLDREAVGVKADRRIEGHSRSHTDVRSLHHERQTG